MNTNTKKRLIDANAPMIKECFNPQLIDYREFVKECNHFYENPPFPHPATPWHKGLQLAVEIAMRLPKVDAVEVVHGRWAHLGGDEWCCTACGEVIHTEGSWEKPTRKYCHECGAKMDEEAIV